MVNNLIIGSTLAPILLGDDDVRCDKNIISGASGPARCTNTTTNAVATTEWVDSTNATLANRDYHLKAGSISINNGTPTICTSADVSANRCVTTITRTGFVGPAPDQGAYEYGSTPLLPGDLNGDGARTLTDVRWLIEMLVGTRDKTTAADLNHDGNVTLADCQALIRLLVRIP